MGLTNEELARMNAPKPPPTRIEKLEAALRYYASADFLTTEQQAVAEKALKR